MNQLPLMTIPYRFFIDRDLFLCSNVYLYFIELFIGLIQLVYRRSP